MSIQCEEPREKKNYLLDAMSKIGSSTSFLSFSGSIVHCFMGLTFYSLNGSGWRLTC